MPTITSAAVTPRCYHCKSELVVVQQVTEQLENHYSSTTTTSYRCSNDECQADIDRKNAARVKLQADQDKAKADRVQAKLDLKKH